MASDLCYEPGRLGHVAAAVEGKLYVWGGMGRDSSALHDGLEKTAITSVVDVLDLQVNKNYLYNKYFGNIACKQVVGRTSCGG